MTCKFCGLKYIFNNFKLFKSDEKKKNNKNDIETDVSQRYAVFSRARSLKLVGPNLVCKGSDVFKVEAIMTDTISLDDETLEEKEKNKIKIR